MLQARYTKASFKEISLMAQVDYMIRMVYFSGKVDGMMANY
jgi:hypothetical protein